VRPRSIVRSFVRSFVRSLPHSTGIRRLEGRRASICDEAASAIDSRARVRRVRAARASKSRSSRRVARWDAHDPPRTLKKPQKPLEVISPRQHAKTADSEIQPSECRIFGISFPVGASAPRPRRRDFSTVVVVVVVVVVAAVADVDEMFKDEKRTQYSPLMTREEQVRRARASTRAPSRRVASLPTAIQCNRDRARADAFARGEGASATRPTTRNDAETDG